MTYIQPRASYSPIGRQPFRPGQWQGFKGVSKHTTYIQNNFFGNSYGTGMNYGNYSNSYCNTSCDNGGMSKGMKWLLGLGAGATLLGGILKMFGVGGKEELGSVEPETKAETKVKEESKAEDKAKVDATKVETPPVEVKPEEVKPETVEAPKQDNINWKNGANMVCTDASGKTSNIEGKLTLGDNGNPPQSFTITDKTSGNVYKYELQEAKEGEKPVYKCVSKNGQAASSNNAYTLENDGNGNPKLVQHENQGNFGQGLQFGSTAPQTFSKTMTVHTSVGQGTVTVTANSQKELDEKVKAREDESAKWAPKQETPQGTPAPKPAANNPAASNPWAELANNNTEINPWAKFAGATSQTQNAPKAGSGKTPESITNEIKSSPKYKNCNVQVTKNSDGSYQVKITNPQTHNEQTKRIADLNKFDINEFGNV